jgi:hypothetical protein
MLKKIRKYRIKLFNIIVLVGALFFLLGSSSISVAGGSVSSGTYSRLDQYRPLYSYSLPRGKDSYDIVGMGIAGSNDHVYVWYRDGTVSSGTSDDLDRYSAPYAYSLPRGKNPYQIVGMGIAGSNDHVYVWYED